MTRHLGLAVALLAYLAACAAGGLYGDLQPDEGVTVNIAIGHYDREALDDGEPVPIDDVYARFDGRELLAPGDVLAGLQSEANPYPPAYYLLLNRWAALAGTGRVALRLPSVLCGLLMLLGLAALARRLVPHPGADTWIALLAALSPWLAGLGTFARPYALPLAIATWATVAALAIADQPARRAPRVAFVLLSLLGLYTLYHYGFVLLWQAVFLLATLRSLPAGQRLRAFGGHVLMGIVVTAGFLPWLPALRGHLELTGSMSSYYLAPALEGGAPSFVHVLTSQLLGDAVRGGLRLVLTAVLGLLAGLAAVAFVRRWRGARGGDPVGRALLWTAPLYPLVILAADEAHGVRTLLVTKTSFFLFALVLLLLVRGLYGLRPALRTAGLLVALALQVTATVVSVQERLDEPADDQRRVAEALAAADDEDHFLLLNTGSRSHALPLLMTLREEGVHRLRVVSAPPARLADVLGRTLARTDATRLTLVNLHTKSDPRRAWSPAQLEAALDQARAAGWRVSRAKPARLGTESPVRDGRVLAVIDPVL